MADFSDADLSRKLRQVRRRRFWQTLLRVLPSCLAGALVLAATWIVVQRSLGLPYLQEPAQGWAALAALLGGASALAFLWASFRRPSPVAAALALDEAFHLKERVTTAISLSDEQRRSPAGVALLEDVQRQINSLDAAARFPLTLPRSAALVPAAALGWVLLILFYPERTPPTAGPSPQQQATNEANRPMDLSPLKEAVKKGRKVGKELQSPKYDEIYGDFEHLLRLDKSDREADVQQAIEEATQLAEKIAKRQEELGATKAVQRQLREHREQLRQQAEEGPVKETQEALAEGDFEQAQKKLNELAQALKENQLSEQDQKALEKQLDRLQQQLQDIVEQKERKEKLAQGHLDPEAQKREEEQIRQDTEKLKAVQELSTKLGQCRQALKEGDSTKAAEELKEASAQLEQMAKDQKEAQQLQQAMQDVDKLKECLG